MRKRTTTSKIYEAITNNMLHITKAECYHKTSRKIETIDAVKLHENFSFLCESGCFMDALGWHYERDFEARGYIGECGRMNPNTEIIISVYFRVANGVGTEEVEKILKVEEE